MQIPDGIQHLAQWIALASFGAAMLHNSWVRRTHGHRHNLELERRVAGLEERVRPMEGMIGVINTKLDNILYKVGLMEGKLSDG